MTRQAPAARVDGGTRRRLLALGGAALAPSLAAGQTPAPAAPAASTPTPVDGNVVVVEIREYRYHPRSIVIKPGTTVRWVNAEKRTTHTVRFSGPTGSESERLFPGETFERRFDQTGYFAYTCGPHPEMTGEIDVRP